MTAGIWISFDPRIAVKNMKNRFKKLFYETLEEKEFLHSRFLSVIGLILSIALIYGVWFFSERFFYHQSQMHFEHHVNEDLYSLEHSLKKYKNALQSGIGFLQASNDVSRTDWHRYVKAIDLKRNYPGMQGIGYSTVVSPDAVQTIENKMHREGYPSFEINPKGKREFYTTILYLEPLDKRNQAAIGYDMYSEPVRREAMERSRDSGKEALSGKVTLLQEIDKDIQAGVLMYLPYYADGEEADTVEERRRSLIGYIYAPFRMGDFMHANFTHKDIMSTEVYDGAGKNSDNLLYKSSAFPNYHSDYRTERILNVGGREWHLFYSSSPAFDARHSSQYPILFTLIGLILNLIMLYVIVELLKKRSMLKIKTEALKHEKEIAQNYLDIVEVMVLVLDCEHTIQVINRRGCEIIGYRADEAIGKNFIELFIPERIREELFNVANSVIFHNGYEYNENPIITKNGDERLIAWRNRLLKDDEGNVIGILSSGEDITDMRRTQLQLQESEAFYRTVFGSIEESIVILNENRIVDCNDVALRLFDTTKESFIGESIFDTAYEIECQDYPLRHHISIAYNGEFTSARCTLRLHTNPNVVKIVEFSFSRFGTNDENKLVMISRDITRKVEEEKLLTMHGRQAQMGEMISMIAHQWRQPLAIINAITTQMRFKAIMSGSEDDEFVDNLVKIEQQSSHLSQTISDYRDFFRPDKPKEHFNAVSLINHALNLIDHTLKNHSIHIETANMQNLDLFTYRNEVLQVLIVLLKNSLDAFVENKIIGGVITINVQPEDQYCVIDIRDNAGGIPKEIVHKLFSPYFTTKHDGYGTGLGLYMSRIIIEEHCGGLIEVSSEGNSTTFTVKLPCREAE